MKRKKGAAPRFERGRLLEGRRGVEQDVLSALLPPGNYTKAEAEKLRDQFLKKEAK